MSAKDQLRDELLAVAWRYSQESDVTVGETATAFDEALQKLGIQRADRTATSRLVRDLTECLQATSKKLPVKDSRVSETLNRAIGWIALDR